MGFYKDPINFVPHNINNMTILIDGTIKGSSIDTIVAERDEDEVSVENTADGTAIFVENPSTSGKVVMTILEASPMTDSLSDLLDEKRPFTVSVKDSASDKFNVGGTCRIAKSVKIERKNVPDRVEWTFVSTYITMRGGSYSIQQV